MSKEIKTDYCIVGAGIAGLILASRLAKSGKKIVVLDQGPRFTEEDRANMLQQGKETLNDFADYNDNVDAAVVTPHTSATQGNQVAEWIAQRLFGIGGTALHFEGFMLRPREDDMKVKTLYGYGRDWPITYSELESWLLRAENETGVSGNEDNPYASHRSGPFPMPAHPFSYFDREIFKPALKRLGIVGHSCPRAINSQSFQGRSACMACRACKFCPSGARYSPDSVHVPMIENRSNVTILDKVSLRRLETGSKGNRIVAAHTIRIKERTPLVVRAKHFILALGGVETPRILMLSADKGSHKDGLGSMGGQLGRRFSDHTNPFVLYDLGVPVGSRLGFETMISDHFRAQKDRQEQPTLLIVGSPAIDWAPVGHEAALWATKGNNLSLETLRNIIPQIATLWVFTELEGKGTLELDDSKLDAFGSPVAKIAMKLTDWDRKAHSKLTKLLPEIGEAMGAKSVSDIAPPEFGLGYHPSGTTAMAKSPDDGVCDPNLKVFGLENLYLVSNSVFPHMGSNPPTLTIVALALRLASHLEGRTAL
ncbi:MAG: GMC family oxidoreductase [Planctomycetes bacterium]|nr:GMC family oxidoreductase [Planctomycetota bacterium]